MALQGVILNGELLKTGSSGRKGMIPPLEKRREVQRAWLEGLTPCKKRLKFNEPGCRDDKTTNRKKREMKGHENA